MFPLPIPHEDRKSPLDFIPDCADEHGHGEKMWKVMSRLKITQGPLAGKRLGQVAPPWQEKWIRSLYGSTDETGKRTYDEALLLIAKKQGKSTISGMLAIAHTMAFPEQRGSVIILADSKDQAGLVYDSMASTVEADKYLSKQFHVRRYRSDIIHKASQTHLKAVAAELAAVVGQIPSFYIVDELHLLGLKPKGAQLVRQLSSGMAVRENPLGIYITTAPVGAASGIYTSTYNRAHRILNGESENERMFPVCFEIPEDKDPDDHRFWWMANPSLGHTVSDSWLKREHKLAKEDPDPATYANFLSQHLNIHAQEKMGIDRWIPLDVWDHFADKSITLESIIEECDAIFMSVDAGYRRDPSSVVVMGRRDDEYLIWSHQWLHVEWYNKIKDHVPAEEFYETGELTVGERENQDVSEIYDLVIKIWESGKLVCVGVDPAKLLSLPRKIEEFGIRVLAIKQGWQMNNHIVETERLLYSQQIRHFGGSMLRWNIENIKLAQRGQAYALIKPEAPQGGGGHQKIDGAVCVVMAVAVGRDPKFAYSAGVLDGTFGFA